MMSDRQILVRDLLVLFGLTGLGAVAALLTAASSWCRWR